MKKPIVLLLITAALISFAFAVPAKMSRQITVVIDAGHGGHDQGMTADQHLEKMITQSIAEKIKALNTDANIILHFTRNSDTYIDLKDRVEMINRIKPDLVLSLHVNGTKNSEAAGLEFYISDNEDTVEQAKIAANALSKKFIDNHQFNFRGIKTAPFMILKDSQAPAITMELGFLSNKKDRELITNQEEQERIAATIYEFLTEF